MRDPINPLTTDLSATKFILTNRITNRQAFTLIELIVVISLVATMLFFAVPRLDRSLFTDESKKVSRWILLNVSQLKNKAVQSQKRFILNVDMENNRLWISEETMAEEMLSSAENEAFRLPSSFRLLDVEYPDGRRVSSGTAVINFYPKGYSDRAILHMEDDQSERRSYFIEPFLSQVKIRDTYANY